MNNVTAKVRHIDSGDSVLVGQFEPDQLEPLVKTFEKNEIYLGGMGSVRLPIVSSQYVLSDGVCYFEIIIDGELM